MKTYKVPLVAVIILLLTNVTTTEVATQDFKESISISGSFALYPITVK